MRRTAIAAAITAALLPLTACASNDNDAQAKPSEKPSPTAQRLTARQAADKLADATHVKSLGDVKDNTSGCAGKNGCRQLITTNTVSIYEFPDTKVADHWTKTMRRTNETWTQVDRFALSWTARNQEYISKERRAELVAALRKLPTR